MIQTITFFVVLFISMPLVWYILLASNLETCFKQGKIWQIRAAYVVITLVVSFLLALLFKEIAGIFPTNL